MEAENEAAVQSRLRSQQLNPPRSRKGFGLNLKLSFGSGVDSKDLVKFIRSFATMIDAGLPLVQCLEILSNQGAEPRLPGGAPRHQRRRRARRDLQRRSAAQPKIFDDLFVTSSRPARVAASWTASSIGLAVYIEKRVKLQRQVKGALTYPTAVMGIMVIVMTVLDDLRHPAVENMFAEFGAKDALPTLTKVVIQISKGFVTFLPLTILLAVGGTVGAIYFYRSPPGKSSATARSSASPSWARSCRRSPSRASRRTLGTLLASGVPILDALDIVAKTAGNVVVEEGLMYTRGPASRRGETWPISR